MSRPSDTERGASAAFFISNNVLSAHHDGGLFPARLTPDEFNLWSSIYEAAVLTLRECSMLREARRVR